MQSAMRQQSRIAGAHDMDLAARRDERGPAARDEDEFRAQVVLSAEGIGKRFGKLDAAIIDADKPHAEQELADEIGIA